jgi:hypothetical protein
MNATEKRALTWLQTHGGDACFDKNGVAIAQGEHAPVYRATWNKLQQAELIEFYGGKRDGGKGYGRLRLTDAGRAAEGYSKPKPTVHPSRFAGTRNRAPLLDEEA